MRKDEPVYFTDTGWRVVGHEPRPEYPSKPEAETPPLSVGPASDTLYAAVVTVQPRVQGRTAVEPILQAIQESLGPSQPEVGSLRRDSDVELPSSRFGGFSFRHRGQAGGWVGRILWREVHPLSSGAPITTEVTLEETRSYTRLGLRVTADHGLDSVRRAVGAGHAQPAFLAALRKELQFTWLGAPVEPIRIRPGDEVDFVRSTLESPARDFPALVLAPTEEGGHLVDPSELAFQLMGRGRLFLIRNHDQTFRLSDAVGDKRLSCFWGALRVYMPGFSTHDDPYDHPLLVADRVTDPVMRAATIGRLSIRFGRDVELPEVIPEERSPEIDEPPKPTDQPVVVPPDARRNPPTDASIVAGDAAPDGETTPHGKEHEEASPQPRFSGAEEDTVNPQLRALSTGVRDLTGLVRSLIDSNHALHDEIERLRTISAVRSASTSALERRMNSLESMLVRKLAPEWEDGVDESADRPGTQVEDRYTLVQAVRDAQEAHPDTLLFLENAFDSARESPYEDPERVRTILDAMARVARKRGDGELSTTLKEAFAGVGVDYRGGIARSTPKRLRQQYVFVLPDGTAVECEEHIALGQTYNPRRCLRIYFSSRIPSETRFVVAHVGRHFEVITST